MKEEKTIREGEAAGAAVIPAVNKKALIREWGMKAVFIVAAAIFVVVVAVICIYLFARAVPTIGEIGFVEFVFGGTWNPDVGYYGVGSLIVGTSYATACALVVGVPIGLLVAVFMAFYCPKWLYKIMKPVVNILAGIPSIVYGYFGLVVIVPFVRETFGGGGTSLLATAIVLGIMILPTIISISENALRAVPKSYFEGAVALGATKERAIFRTVFPAAMSGIVTSVILALGRAFGETAAVVLICGNLAKIPDSLLDPIRTLSSNIATELGYSTGLHREALIACAVVLFVFILLITVIVMLLRRKKR
ncbi:MAG TPA: phosphate ABC transporter permease subunit PstC [Candidatus Borkfalkia stercoripullorum]|nr:phosphate ABC transporter permease subunit PstC [Candidatus Borkfalkia stercoripullorum]